MSGTVTKPEPKVERGHEQTGVLRHRPSMQHVLHWLTYHARPTHPVHRNPHRPPAKLHGPRAD